MLLIEASQLCLREASPTVTPTVFSSRIAVITERVSRVVNQSGILAGFRAEVAPGTRNRLPLVVCVRAQLLLMSLAVRIVALGEHVTVLGIVQSLD